MIESLNINLVEIPSPMDIHYADKKYYGDVGLALHLIEESSIDEKIIFVENKVDSFEGNGQLEKYSKYLNQVKDKECHLFYCTKIIEKKEVNFSNFSQFRWKKHL